MALTNAERQARYQRKLRDRVTACVTPDEVVTATRLLWEASRRDDPSLPPWDEFLARCRKGGRVRSDWSDMVKNLAWIETDDDCAEYGDDAALVRRVAAIIRAATRPPEA